MDLYNAAKDGDLERVRLLLEQGADKDQIFGVYDQTPLFAASGKCHLPIVQLLIEQGADMEKTDMYRRSPLYDACRKGRLDVARYLLEQGADRDKANRWGKTPLHIAAGRYLEITKLLMVYGADLNARNNNGQLPIDCTHIEEIRQAIRDEPRRRMDEVPGKRATEQDCHPNAAASATTQQEESDEKEVEEPISKRPRLVGGEEKEGKVAEEDEDSEPSDGEDD